MKTRGMAAHLPRNRSRWSYYRRVLAAYVLRQSSHLGFWHDQPEVNDAAPIDSLGEYYMTFLEKADYEGPFDQAGIPQLDYRGDLGVQYNPIAVAQYALGNYNAWRRGSDPVRRATFLRTADWLTDNLERNDHGLAVWHHDFDWEYRDLLVSPWYSGLAQGQGISVLVRAHAETGEQRYLERARQAFEALVTPLKDGGTLWRWPDGGVWIEEYIVDPPTHILNGSIWALWGVHDFHLATGDQRASQLFRTATSTLASKLGMYDTAYWSLYELSGTRLPMLASPFYHRLHVAQLRCMHRLTAQSGLLEYADRWDAYTRQRSNRVRALAGKALFKALYY